MYHIVYLTTNLVNNKIYIGVHSTYDLNDDYLGSGFALKKAINKYGKEKFKREILFYCLSREDAFEIENKIVDLYFINKSFTYNQDVGGLGCMKNRKHSEKTKKIIGIKTSLSIKIKKEQGIKRNNYTEESRKKQIERQTGKPSGAKGKKWSEEQKQKIKKPTQCPHCGLISNMPSLMKRWHFDNCKMISSKKRDEWSNYIKQWHEERKNP